MVKMASFMLHMFDSKNLSKIALYPEKKKKKDVHSVIYPWSEKLISGAKGKKFLDITMVCSLSKDHSI